MKKKSGFTIIEILVACTIVATLAGIFILNFPQSLKKEKDTRRKSDIKQYQSALGVYSARTNGVFPVRTGTVNLITICTVLGVTDCPDDPEAPSSHYSYQTNTTGTEFVIWSSLIAETGYWAACSNGLVGNAASVPINGVCSVP